MSHPDRVSMESLSDPPVHQHPVSPPLSMAAAQYDETDHEEGILLGDFSDVATLSSHFVGILDESFYGRSLDLGQRSRRSSRLIFAVEEDIPLIDMNSPQSDRQMAVENQVTESEERHMENLPLANEWLPYTLRPGYLLFLITVSMSLGITVLMLTWHSTANEGLTIANNSIALLFGWRFAPTLFAVIYNLLESLLLQDVKRTESFARLSHDESSLAKYTLLRSSSFWWNDPGDALSKHRSNGKRSWTLFWSSIANILGFLVISPLSAALLSVQDKSITRKAEFSTMLVPHKTALNMTADDETYLRSTSALLHNLKTSAWLSNDYAILPFWPTNTENIPLGATLARTPQTWESTTTIFKVDLECRSMVLTAVGSFVPGTPSEYSVMSEESLLRNDSYESMKLQSEDGCIYGMAWPSNSEGFWSLGGGGWWVHLSRDDYTSLNRNDISPLGAFSNFSIECGSRDVFFISSPYNNGSMQAKGEICLTSYYMADIATTVSISASVSQVSFDQVTFDSGKRVIDSALLNSPSIETLFLGSGWSAKSQGSLDNEDSTGNEQRANGPLIPITAKYNDDISSILGKVNLADEAQSAKQRFFGEAFLTTIGKQSVPSFGGQISIPEERIVANLGIGVASGSILLLSAAMFTAVLFHSRLRRRPLNLARDPGSAAAIATLLANQAKTCACFEGSDRLSEILLRRTLANKRFLMRRGELVIKLTEQTKQQGGFTDLEKQSTTKDWRPAVLRGWSKLAMLMVFATLIVGLAILYAEARRSALHQTFFVYKLNFSAENRFVTALAPYSIIPTLIAILVKLWWSALEDTFKRLQPYIMMAREPTMVSRGLEISYTHTKSLWTVWKAMSNKHWLLALVCLGAFWTEVFTIGMSALWERDPGSFSHNLILSRQYELRTIPNLFLTTVTEDPSQGNTVPQSIIRQIHGNGANGWLYEALIELAYNGSHSIWTSNDWAFAPVDITNASVPVIQNTGSNTSVTLNEHSEKLGASTNVTVDTPALRGRIECTPVDLSNPSNWLTTLNFSDTSEWDPSSTPPGVKVGYSLGASKDLQYGGFMSLSGEDSPAYTTFFADHSSLACCTNVTNGIPGRAAIGYWSPITSYMGTGDTQERNFTIKWIVGKPLDSPQDSLYRTSDNYTAPNVDYVRDEYFVWKEPPQMTALNCMPIFESSDAKVTVDLVDANVQKYSLNSAPVNATAAWSDDWFLLNRTISLTDDEEVFWSQNVTVSYGYIFLKAILTAAHIMSVTTAAPDLLNSNFEDTGDRLFNFRMKGLNVDFMSFAALSLASRDVEALLDPYTLQSLSSRVFSTFFQHFVTENITLDSGSYGFQPLNTTLPWDLNPILDPEGGGKAWSYQDQNTSLVTNKTAAAILHTEIEQLNMSPAAVILCIVMLSLLAATTVLLQTRYRDCFKALPRDVDTLASVLGFVYGSPKLLRWVGENREKSEAYGQAQGNQDSKDSKDRIITRMGWFDGSRWGIEIVDLDSEPDQQT